MSSTRSRLLTCLTISAIVAFGVVGGVVTAAPPSSESDPKAVAVAERVMTKLGGAEAWKAVRLLRFDFAVDREGKTLVRRAHTWDRSTGRYRVEGPDDQGRAVVVLMSLWTTEGKAWVDGVPATGEELAGLVETGYAWWVNDSYWLLMPFKLRDPGVVLSYVGLEARQEQSWDKVLLTFEGVGLTPKDKYWVYVNRKTDLVDRWEFVLKGADTPPAPWDWSGWAEHGGVLLANDRTSPNDGTRIRFPVLEAPASVPDAVFEQP
mgnify:CR=1 FL=1